MDRIVIFLNENNKKEYNKRHKIKNTIKLLQKKKNWQNNY